MCICRYVCTYTYITYKHIHVYSHIHIRPASLLCCIHRPAAVEYLYTALLLSGSWKFLKVSTIATYIVNFKASRLMRKFWKVSTIVIYTVNFLANRLTSSASRQTNKIKIYLATCSLRDVTRSSDCQKFSNSQRYRRVYSTIRSKLT